MHRLALAAGIVAVVVSPATAQNRRALRADHLLENESVQKELKLTDEQIKKSKEVIDKVKTKFAPELLKVFDLSGEARREKEQEVVKAIREEATKEMEGVLTKEQVKRFKQIRLQAEGATVFQKPDILKAMKFSDDQMAQLRTIRQDANQQMRKVRQKHRGRPEEAKQLDRLNKETLQKIIDVLDASQKETWRDLTGEPFEIKTTPSANSRRESSDNK
jgi:hypothetical protein